MSSDSANNSRRFRDERISGDETPSRVLDRKESKVVPQRIMTAKYLDMAVSATPRLLGIILRMRAILESTPEQKEAGGITDEDLALAEAIYGTALSLFKHSSQDSNGHMAVNIPFLAEDKELMREWVKWSDADQIGCLAQNTIVVGQGEGQKVIEILWDNRGRMTQAGLENLQTLFMRRMDPKIRPLIVKAYKMIDADDLMQASQYSSRLQGRGRGEHGTPMSEALFGSESGD